MHWPIAQAADAVRPKQASDLISPKDLPLTETWGALEACVDAGLVKHIGVANFSIPKSASPDHMKQNLDAQHTVLSQDDMAAIARMERHYIHAQNALGRIKTAAPSASTRIDSRPADGARNKTRACS